MGELLKERGLVPDAAPRVEVVRDQFHPDRALEGIAELAWSPRGESARLPPVAVAASLEGGVIRVVTEEIRMEAGSASARAMLRAVGATSIAVTSKPCS